MAWWDKVGGDEPGEQQRQGSSVYADRFTDDHAPRIAFANGQFVEIRPCCENPLECERPECWRPLSEWGRWP
jgi:hypothetical protein